MSRGTGRSWRRGTACARCWTSCRASHRSWCALLLGHCTAQCTTRLRGESATLRHALTCWCLPMQERIYEDTDGARKEELAALRGPDNTGFRWGRVCTTSDLDMHARLGISRLCTPVFGAQCSAQCIFIIHLGCNAASWPSTAKRLLRPPLCPQRLLRAAEGGPRLPPALPLPGGHGGARCPFSQHACLIRPLCMRSAACLRGQGKQRAA